MNITAIDDALSAALNSLAAAQAILRKSAPPRSLDVLRKINDATRASDTYDTIQRSVATILADAELRIARLEERRDREEQEERQRMAERLGRSPQGEASR